jgi:dihydrofolate synthase/folylpolyglutamate synthase
VVLECGLGGRLDATNIVNKPECVALTSIGLDHTEVLGTTYGEISGEKAEIIKDLAPYIVLGPTCHENPESYRSIEKKIKDHHKVSKITGTEIQEINNSIA